MSVVLSRSSSNLQRRPFLRPNILAPATRYLHPIQHSRDPSLEPEDHFTSSPQVPGPQQSSISAASGHHLDRSQPRYITPLPPNSLGSDETVTPSNYRRHEVGASNYDGTPEPASSNYRRHEVAASGYDGSHEPSSKRRRLSDDGWIEQSLELAKQRRGGPDPNPMPKPTPPPPTSGQFLEPFPRMRQQSQASPAWLGPSGLSQSPGMRSVALSRRPSSSFVTSSPSPSPALTHKSIVSSETRRQSAASPPASSVVGGFSDLGLGSRASSVAVEGGDSSTTFRVIHNVPIVELPARMTADPSHLERLPKEVFMRIMMFCDYKAQVLLKKCSYSLYAAVNLEDIPWQVKTAAILSEEINNPRNRNIVKAANHNNEDNDDDVDVSKKARKRKRPEARTAQPDPHSATGKSKPHPDTYGRWGCYCCYKILPAQYFEGALLEDREGRNPKTNKLRGASNFESDKKVDMRVEYAQVLQAVPGRSIPDWLSRSTMEVEATDVEAYVRERGRQGVNCDDLRAYYKDITKDTHLMAPIRGITPVFTPSSLPIPEVDLSLVSRAQSLDSARSPPTTRTPLPRAPLPAIHTREEQQETLESEAETSRPLYKLHGDREPQGNTDNSSYTYELRIPRGASRVENPPVLPVSKPVSRICLPPKKTMEVDPVIAPGDVVALRRVCILCGTKYGIYRRDCNRKIISKTDEQWWPCDCFEVRAAGRSTGCLKCGKKVIY